MNAGTRASLSHVLCICCLSGMIWLSVRLRPGRTGRRSARPGGRQADSRSREQPRPGQARHRLSLEGRGEEGRARKGRVTIAHEAIPGLHGCDDDAVLHASDRASLENVKPGDLVEGTLHVDRRRRRRERLRAARPDGHQAGGAADGPRRFQGKGKPARSSRSCSRWAMPCPTSR